MVISWCNEVEYIFVRHEPWKKLHLRSWLVLFSFFFAGLVGLLIGWLVGRFGFREILSQLIVSE